MRTISSLLLIATCLTGLSASAASFDCTKASTAVEKAICADAKLSKLDERMAAAYKVRQADWNGTNAAYVKADQRAYLRLYHEINHPEESEIEPVCTQTPKPAFISCLSEMMLRRVEELENPDYKLSGVYFRGKDEGRDGMILVWPARKQGVESVRVTLKKDGQFYGTWSTLESASPTLNSSVITVKLPADSPLTKPCTITLNVAAGKMDVATDKGCGGDVPFAGTYVRDVSDLLSNHDLDAEF